MLYNLFSRREEELKGDRNDDLLIYDVLPQGFRVQVFHILDEIIGRWDEQYATEPRKDWNEIFNIFAREKAWNVFSDGFRNTQADLSEYLLKCDTQGALDLIELCFRWINVIKRDREERFNRQRYDGRQSNVGRLDDATEELNDRFRLHRLGYEYRDGSIMRVDSQLIHAEAVCPAFQLLKGGGPNFSGPLQEFTDAYHKYREGEYKDAVVGTCRSFESVMKSICTERGWAFDAHKATASELIRIVIDNGLIPTYLETQYSSLKAVLQSGVATIRNKTSGHGQGPTVQDVPEHFVSYALHLTASSIVFLIESHKALP